MNNPGETEITQLRKQNESQETTNIYNSHSETVKQIEQKNQYLNTDGPQDPKVRQDENDKMLRKPCITTIENMALHEQDNKFLLTGYRLNYNSFKPLLFSICQCHNELINIWTHLIGFILCLIVLFYSLADSQVLPLVKRDHFLDTYVQKHSEVTVQDLGQFPMQAYLITSAIVFGFSFTFHWFNAHSKRWFKILQRLDFAGATINMFGSCVACYTYGFYCQPVLKYLYLGIIGLFSLVCFVLSLMEFLTRVEYRNLKIGIFAGLLISLFIPCIHLVISEKTNPKSDYNSLPGLAYYLLGAVSMGIGIVFYKFQAPERCVPKTFDYCGNSHSIWHIFVMVATVINMLGTYDNYYRRQVCKCLEE